MSETTEQIETGVGWAKAQVRVSRQGQGRIRLTNPYGGKEDGETTPEPAVLCTEHRPQPEPPPRWQAPQSARQEARKIRDQAAAMEAEAEKIERDHDAKIRRIDAMEHVVALKTKELLQLERNLSELDSDTLGKRFEQCYWTYKYHPLDQHSVNQFLIAGNLAANSKRLRTLLENKIAESSRSIAEAQTEIETLETQLEAANTETV